MKGGLGREWEGEKKISSKKQLKRKKLSVKDIKESFAFSCNICIFEQSCRLYSNWRISKASNLFFKLLKYSLNLFCAIMNYFLFKFTLFLIELSDLLILDILKLNLCNYAQYHTFFFSLICLMICNYVLDFYVINVSFVTKISLLLSPLMHYQSWLSCF